MDINKIDFTRLELEVLSYLCIKAGTKLSQREIAIALGVSPTAVANSVRNLKIKNLVKIEVVKTINFTSLNRENPKAIFLKKVENQKQLYISGLQDFLEEQLAGATIILFGSYAKGEDTINSDIDIAVIGRKEKSINTKFYEKTLKRHININFYDFWKDIHKHLRNNILNGVVLCGSVDL